MQKNKMLRLVEILRQESDSSHPLKTNQLIEKLALSEISCDRKTLARDMAQLKGLGYDVVSVKSGHSNAYYMQQNEFSLAELKILIDAIQAASFITEEMTASITDKLASLGGVHCGELLRQNRVQFNVRKQNNNDILNTIEIIEQAIRNETQISFRYFKHDELGNRVFLRNGDIYTVEPIAPVYTDDKYYLLCYNPKRNDRRHYRIDRMCDVCHTQIEITENSRIGIKELATYTSRIFKMYGGEEAEVTFEFDDSLIDVFYDKFGMDMVIKRIDEKRCSTTRLVQISGTFWGWICQFDGKIQIVSPESVRLKYIDYIDRIREGF